MDETKESQPPTGPAQFDHTEPKFLKAIGIAGARADELKSIMLGFLDRYDAERCPDGRWSRIIEYIHNESGLTDVERLALAFLYGMGECKASDEPSSSLNVAIINIKSNPGRDSD